MVFLITYTGFNIVGLPCTFIIFCQSVSFVRASGSGDEVIRPPEGLRNGFTYFTAGTDILTHPPKHESSQLLMPPAVTHAFSDRTKGSLT